MLLKINKMNDTTVCYILSMFSVLNELSTRWRQSSTFSFVWFNFQHRNYAVLNPRFFFFLAPLRGSKITIVTLQKPKTNVLFQFRDAQVGLCANFIWVSTLGLSLPLCTLWVHWNLFLGGITPETQRFTIGCCSDLAEFVSSIGCGPRGRRPISVTLLLGGSRSVLLPILCQGANRKESWKHFPVIALFISSISSKHLFMDATVMQPVKHMENVTWKSSNQ